MTIQDLGSLGELIAAIATVATLGYLALQIRQNTRAVRGATIHAITSGMQSELHWSHDIAAVWVKVMERPEELTSTEAWDMNAWLIAAMLAGQNEFFQHRRGLLDAELWAASENIIRVILSIPWTRNWWYAVGRDTSAAAFAAHVDRLAAEPPPHRLDEILERLRAGATPA